MRRPPSLVLCVFLLLLPATATADLVVTEILAEPRECGDELGEWLEIWNRGESPVDLRGWVLRDDDFDFHRIESPAPVVVPPDAHVVLARAGALLRRRGVPVFYVYGDDLVLDDEEDEVRWAPLRGWPQVPGRAMAWTYRGDNDDPLTWRRARDEFALGDHGSPGRSNLDSPRRPPGAREDGGERVFRASVALRRTWLSEQRVSLDAGTTRADGSVTTLRFHLAAPAGRDAWFLAVIPLAWAHVRAEVLDYSRQEIVPVEETGHALGNPFVGWEIPGSEGGPRWLLGAYAPLSPASGEPVENQSTAVLAVGSEFVRDAESFAPDAVPVVAEAHGGRSPQEGVAYAFRGGTRIWLPIDERRESEFFLVYGARVGVRGATLRPSLFLDGRFHVSSQGDEGRFHHVAGLAAAGSWGRMRIDGEVILPLDETLRDLVDWGLRLVIAVDLP